MIPAFENAGARADGAFVISQVSELSMGRRKELKGICNDLLDSFVSRYNDIDGYWALGQFQTYLQSTGERCVRFSFTDPSGRKSAFPLTLNYYRFAFERHLKVKDLPRGWVADADLVVEQQSPSQLICSLKITDDKGRAFEARRLIHARPHDPSRELRRRGKHGPQNQLGV